MTLDLLREKRKNWVLANKENGFEDGIKRLLTDLYPDNAHFIYELLQNAEDTRANTVRFTLANDSLEFEHDGQRLFSLKDVESITSIGVSTKRDDPTSIGKFGVGFKAVFAYTNTPEIHSGDYRFRIHDLVVPETVGIKKLASGDHETRFIFPFNHQRKLAARAIEEVERALRALGDNTLLFLEHIRSIEYLLPDGSLGSLERIDHEDSRIEIRASHPGGKDTASHWLRFQKGVQITDEDGKPKDCRIAIAYGLEKEVSGSKHLPEWKIMPLDHGQVSIYFPAEKETSKLRLHLHAPFASTVARDSVRNNCEANHKLRDHIADLLVESFTEIRDRRMLTMDFLAVLPNETDNLSSFYEPLREAAVHAFRNEPLTPTKAGTHAPATGLYRGPAKISDVLVDSDLSLLTNHESPLWAANPRQQNQREDRFLESLQIDNWGWSELVDIFSEPYPYAPDDDEEEENTKHKQTIENWITQKDDAWLMRFYALLGEAFETHDEQISAEKLRIVRVQAGQGHEHVLPEEAFLPPAEGAEPVADVRFVKPSTYKAGRSEAQRGLATAFLEHIGVRSYDAKAVIELKIARYDTEPEQIEDDHYRDIEQFIAYWKEHKSETSVFHCHSFLIGENADGSLHWRKPRDLCLDDPYEETGLAELSKIHKKYSIWSAYQEKLDAATREDFVAFVQAIGVIYDLKVFQLPSTSDNPHKDELRKDYRYGVKRTYSAIDEDYSISQISAYLSANLVSASRLVWGALIRADRKASKARFRPNQRYDTREADSQLVCALKQRAWIPDKSGAFRKPEELTKDDLRTDFPYDDRNGLLTAIGFGKRAKQQSEEYLAKNEAAKGIGFNSAEEAEELAKLVSETGVTPEEIRSLISERQRASQPEESVPNPERRRRGIRERQDNAPNKESVMRERSIQVGVQEDVAEAKAYLRAKYTNQDGLMVCQCCQTEMPFKLSGGDYYFEAVQCVRDLPKLHPQNRLALCPNCAAMYQYARETDDGALRNTLLNFQDELATSAEFAVSLAGKDRTLRFVGTHWFDLKTILE